MRESVLRFVGLAFGLVWSACVMAAGSAGGSLGHYLAPDGTLDLPAGFSGSLDPKGFQMITEADGKPRFIDGESPEKLFGVPGGCDGPIYAAALAPTGIVYLGGRFSVCEDALAANIVAYDPGGKRFYSLGRGEKNGVDGLVQALAVSAGTVFVGGSFSRAGGVPANNIARWDGSAWASMGTGAANGIICSQIGGECVRAIISTDEGVYVGGAFGMAGGLAANHIAHWREEIWRPLQDGAVNGVNGIVRAFAIMNDGLYVGGAFDRAGIQPANRIARWNGRSWSALGVGTNNGVAGGEFTSVVSLAASSESLYAGGNFTSAGDQPSRGIARWNGSSWASLGSGTQNGIAGSFAYVETIAVSGGSVYVGGQFTEAGGAPAVAVARWDGSRWFALGSGIGTGNGCCLSELVPLVDNLLVVGSFSLAGGEPASNMAIWDGSAWENAGLGFGNGINGTVLALAVFQGELYVGGMFSQAANLPVNAIARWNGSTWAALGQGQANGLRRGALRGFVDDFTIYGGELVVGGFFSEAGNLPANNIASWDGMNWSPIGEGTENGVNSNVRALAATGSDLYVGGFFSQAGSRSANGIARWNGSEWTSLGTGQANGVSGVDAYTPVVALALAGGELYAGGWFTVAGGQPANRIARWNGREWSSLGQGEGNGVNALIFAIVVANGNLFVGGGFNVAGGRRANGVAKWDGTAWSPLGHDSTNGVNGYVGALAADGSSVYVGGGFTQAGGVPANGLARWSEAGWQGLAITSPPQTVGELFVDGTSLYVGGGGLTKTPLPDLQSKSPVGASGNAASDSSVASRGGERLAFTSRASNLGSDDADTLSDIFIRNPSTGTIARASAAAEQIGPASESFDDPSISPDGSTVVFTGSSGEIYLVQGGVGRRINVNTGGALGNGAGKDPVIRGPGPGDKVYFASEASNITGNDNNGFADIFVRNVGTGALQRLSDGAGGVPSNGPSSKPDASEDGSVVAFTTRATNIVPTGAVPNTDQIVAVAGATKSYISRNVNTGQTGNANSRNVRITPDGRFGVFESDASNLVPDDTNNTTDIFWFERTNGQVSSLVRVSVSRYGIQSNGPSRNPSISDDGQYVTYETDATNLIELDRNGVTDILIRWMVTGEVLRLSRTVDGEQPNGNSSRPMISGDGSTIVFGSDARNLTANDTNNARDVFSVRLREPAPAVVVTGPQDEPSVTGYALPAPNPANASCPAGFFIASVDDGPGSGLTTGIFGVELLLDAPGTRLLDGGLNFGGLIDAGQVGFAGFNFTNPANEMQRVTLSLTGNPASGTTGSLPVRVNVIRQTTAGNTTVFDTTRTINLTTPYVTSIDLTPGFYVATVAATGGTVGGAAEGQFFLGMQTSFTNRPGGGFQGGAVVGGYHAQNPAVGPSGFAGFCLGTQHSTSIRVLSRPTYGETGAKDLRLRLQDAQQRVLVDVPAG